MEFVKSCCECVINVILCIVEVCNSVIEDVMVRFEIFFVWEKFVIFVVFWGLFSIVIYFDLWNVFVMTAVVDDSFLSLYSIFFEFVDGILSGLCEVEFFGGGFDSVKVVLFCCLVYVIVL